MRNILALIHILCVNAQNATDSTTSNDVGAIVSISLAGVVVVVCVIAYVIDTMYPGSISSLLDNLRRCFY